MKRILKFLIVIAIVGFIVYLIAKPTINEYLDKLRIQAIKSGKYLEVVYEDHSDCKKIVLSNGKGEDCIKYDIKVRSSKELKTDNIIGKATKGEVYKIVKVYEDDPDYLWFEIDFIKKYGDRKYKGFIAQPRNSDEYVKFYGIEIDYATPTIGFDDDEYRFTSIDNITYDHLRVWDDQPGYTISSEVYIERKPADGRPGPQYWIKYIVTDKTGKSNYKVQRALFDTPPSDSQVKEFEDMYK